MMRGNTWRFFSEKSYLFTVRFRINLDVLFVYSKDNCIIWHLLASISALLDFISSSVPAVLDYRLFSNTYKHRLTHYWLKGDSLEFIVFITLKWSNLQVAVLATI